MKNTLKTLLIVFAVAGLLASCKKDENRISVEGGTPPVFTATQLAGFTPMLRQVDSLNPFMRLSWTNPNYRFTTGISSQDVTYVLQIDSAGRNFSSPRLKEVSFARTLDTTFNVRAFNQLLANMPENVSHTMEMRIKSSIGTSAALPLFSNVVRLTVTPYLDVAVPVPPSGELYITGDAVPSSWTNSPPVSQKFTKKSTTEYEITMALAPGKAYKFLSNQGQWQPQYGGKTDGTASGGGDLGFNMGGGSDPDAIPTPTTAGNYKISVNFKTGKYTVEKI